MRTKLLSIFCCVALAPALGWAQATVYATGLKSPVKLDTTRGGALLVSERGTGNNDGRLSRVDSGGAIVPLVDGFGSGLEVQGQPAGPSAVLARGCCSVDLVMGEGDVLRFGPNGPPQQVPNLVGSKSPTFSSVLRLHFDRPLDQVTGGFTLTLPDHFKLTDGETVRLENAAGEKVWIRMVADLKDFWPDPITNVRGSNPFAMATSGLFDCLVAVDAGQNSVVQIDLIGPPKTVLRFPPIPNAPGSGPPFSDAVPTGIRHVGGSKYIVSLLTGVPFTPGAASIRLVDIDARTQSTLIPGLTAATDVLKIGGTYYVLEISTNLMAGAPGRLLRIASPGATPTVAAFPVIGGSGMTYAKAENAIYIAEIFTGRIVRVQL